MTKQLLVLAGFMSATICYGQQRLSLQDAVNTALKNSFDIHLAKNNVEISSINNNYGIAGGLPLVTGNATDNEQVTNIKQTFSDPSRNATANNVGSNTIAANITGTMLLFNGYRVVTTKKRLEELEKQNQQLLNAQIQNTIAAVMTKYYDVVRQQNYIKTIAKSIEVANQRLSILQTRKEVGLSNNADLFQAQLDVNGLHQTQQSQQLVIDQSKTDLLNLIAASPDSIVVIADTIIVDAGLRLDSVRTYIRQNPQLISADQQIRINELIEKETSSQRYPAITANAGYRFNNTATAAGFSRLNQSHGPFLGVGLSIPIYNGGIVKRQEKIANINTKSAIVQRDQLLLNFENIAVRTYQAYANSLQQLQTQKSNTELSTKLLDLVLQRFQLGQATIIEVRQAQESFENEGYRLVNLNYAAKVAEISLKQIANKLTY